MKRQIARIARAPDDESANAALRFAVRSAHWSGRLVRLRDLWPAFSIRAAQMSSLEFLKGADGFHHEEHEGRSEIRRFLGVVSAVLSRFPTRFVSFRVNSWLELISETDSCHRDR
jgi:hypothetical protein